MSLNAHYCSQQEEPYLTSPRGSDTTLLPQQEEEKIPFCPVTARPMKSHYTSNIQIPPRDSLFITAPPKFIKEYSPLLFLSWVVHLQTTCPELQFFCCSQINSSCWRNIWLSICIRSTRNMIV